MRLFRRSGREVAEGFETAGSRRIAAVLKVNRMTVLAALNELDAQGWKEMLARKGTFIKTTLPIVTPKKIAVETIPFSLPEKTGFTYDENSIIPVYVPGFPSPLVQAGFLFLAHCITSLRYIFRPLIYRQPNPGATCFKIEDSTCTLYSTPNVLGIVNRTVSASWIASSFANSFIS